MIESVKYAFSNDVLMFFFFGFVMFVVSTTAVETYLIMITLVCITYEKR